MRLPEYGSVVQLGMILLLSGSVFGGAGAPADDVTTARVVSLDGGNWLLAPDPENAGRDGKWFLGPWAEAKPAKVPWIIQDTLPGYHGIAWYWRTFTPPENLLPQGRCLLRFWAVDYKADVWLNGVPVGGHEGGESPFELDVTKAIKPGEANLLAVRVLNPTHSPIDGIVLNETAHRNKALPYRSGSAWDQGGIVDSVELVMAPAVRLTDLFVRPDWKTGTIRVQAAVHNAGQNAAPGRLEFSVAPGSGGETIAAAAMNRSLPPGDTLVETELQVDNPRLWELNDPFLYRVTARVGVEGSPSRDDRSTRCGFRDFRFADGYFRLNGRRIYIRGSHTGNCCPVGLEMPHDPDFLRRDLLNVKAMRFNMIRFIAGVAKRYQLDLCDEIGLLVYEESYAAWLLSDSPKMPERYDESALGMVRRDRNHPSVVMWGLLNETPDGPVFRHAVDFLPALRRLDDSRMVMLNSGRWDSHASGNLKGIEAWQDADRVDPCVTRNATTHVVRGLGITWAPGQLAFHPGRNGEYGVVRWTAPEAGPVDFAAVFTGIAEKATTDVHVLHNGKAIFDAPINVGDGGNTASFSKKFPVQQGDTIDCAVGYGNGNYGADTTALAVSVTAASGKTFAAADEFSVEKNPSGVWSYGRFAAGPSPDASTFRPFPKGIKTGDTGGVGSLSNPGSDAWEDVLSDQHPYQRVPHTAEVIRTLRALEGQGRPIFLSEYGVGSAIDLPRVVRLYEQIGWPEADDAQFYRRCRDRFLADWKNWRMGEVFDRPEDFFAQCLGKMAGQRLLGINAIRANPNVVGYSLTGTVDQGMTGEGLTTTFRELKPGTIDALFDALAPLRFCLFVEPLNVYRGAPVRLEAVLANEDALRPGEYPVRLEVVGPGTARVFQRTVTLTIPDPKDRKDQPELPLVLPLLAEDVAIDGPPGAYRFLATFERGAAAAGEQAEFFVADPADMPPVETDVFLWGEDPELAQWLAKRAIKVRPGLPEPGDRRAVILVSRSLAAPGHAAAFGELTKRIAGGSTAVFLCPEVFRRGDDPVGWLPLERKGSLATLRSWVYLKDEWAKRHPVFDGLPAGELMDLAFYRELIPDLVWAGQDPPAEAIAGANNTSQDYSSGLLVAVYRLGEGRFLLNTLRIRENLASHPAAERLLRNMLRWAANDAAKPTANP
jgi:hypothetical protein